MNAAQKGYSGIEVVVADESDWTDTGNKLRALDPEMYVRILTVAKRAVVANTEPEKIVAEMAAMYVPSLDESTDGSC